MRKRFVKLWCKTCVLRRTIDSCHVDNPHKSHCHRERRKNSDKSSLSQPSLFHLCLPNPPPHHTPELTATEFTRAVRENELRKPIFHLCLPKPPPHHTLKLTATEVAGVMLGAWKHTGAAMSHDPKVFFNDFPFSPIWISNYWWVFLGLWVFLGC